MIDPQPARPSILGAVPVSERSCEFVVWAPYRKRVELQLTQQGTSRRVPLDRDALGYHRVLVDQVTAGARYKYKLDESLTRPDPASRYQPEGVHDASEIVSLSDFAWTDKSWTGVDLEDSVFYELHIGTYTPEGTLASLIPRLDDLARLGITTIELMPVAQYPGARNWGYDGVYPFAVQNTYGSPRNLQEFVNSAHGRGLAVALDVVYNHLGPEGNYLSEYGPYFTDHYHTPWGAALNFDRAHSDEVRFFFIQNALYWLREFHIDALRLDAVHSIFDASAYPFLADLSDAVAAFSANLGRKIHLIAESDLNDNRVLRPSEAGGFGMHAQWSDDFHHSVHTLLTGEKTGYYCDFGTTYHLTKTLNKGWYYSGEYSRHRQRRHGNCPRGLAPTRFVVCNQNHDQVGNRARGERLSGLVDFEGLKLAAGITVLSPFEPMLFMGEEYGERAPFLYFTSHGDLQLGEAVRRGREAEFASFGWKGGIPDPQAEWTFTTSKLDLSLAEREPHATLRRFYGMLLQFRRARNLGRATHLGATEYPLEKVVIVRHRVAGTLLAMVFHFGDAATTLALDVPGESWIKVLDSADEKWRGPGPALLLAQFDPARGQQVTMQSRSFLVLEHVDRTPGA